ncbi:MAG: hypothetical protein Q4A54_04225 [Parabacteroides sp.]|nr:hypothetical protein [Parabacteroides sp.]
MKKIVFLLFLLVGFSFQSFAQDAKPKKAFNKEAYMAKRNAFITAEMGLTPEEAAAFIPLSTELHIKMYEAGLTCRKLARELKHNEEATDADYLKAIDETIAADTKVAELEREYYQKFKKILPPQKLYKYKGAEIKFMKAYMKDQKKNKDKGRKR